MITYRKANPEDIRPALNLALRVFNEYEAPVYENGAVDKFKADCIENEKYIENYLIGKHLMFIAVDNKNIVGIVNERGNGRISMLFVDGKYHRQGIATVLMERIVCELKIQGVDKLTLHSSQYAVPFYRNFGFVATDVEQKIGCFIITPMEYTPNEIWDILDENGNHTGRFHERGRKMGAGDYHLEVHVWIENGNGEFLISQRSPNKSFPNMWECTGGSAIAGDGSLTTALKEVKEELGVVLGADNGRIIQHLLPCNNIECHGLIDVWIFRQYIDITTALLAPDETCDVMWATSDKIREMMAAGEFLSERFYPYLDEMIKKRG